jgi:hypothetical protein
MWVESHGGMIGKTEELGEKTCPIASLSPTNTTWNNPDMNPGLRGKSKLNIVLETKIYHILMQI